MFDKTMTTSDEHYGVNGKIGVRKYSGSNNTFLQVIDMSMGSDMIPNTVILRDEEVRQLINTLVHCLSHKDAP